MAHQFLTLVPFQKVVVANRGAVAARILRALSALNVSSVAVFSDADADAPYLQMADEVFNIGPAPVLASYLNPEALLKVVRLSGADGLHPGYGFLSESASFARSVLDAGARWIGPSPAWIDQMGNKAKARAFAQSRALPVGPGASVVAADPEAVLAAGHAVGFPILVKPVAGGGGIGMVPATSPEQLLSAVERASAMAERVFADPEVYLERLLNRPRHVEYQILGDSHGDLRHLFERDCSVQRRRQKIVEEAPAPGVVRSEVDAFADRLVEIFRGEGYDNIGTIETLVADGESQFLEMNTRLQVEHGVTEEVTGIDLVEAQILLASGETLTQVIPSEVRLRGHAIEARVYAEDPESFLPSPGRLNRYRVPNGVRVETGYRQGQEVTPFYDPLLAQLIAHGETREEARGRLVASLEEFRIEGVKHNIPALTAILRSEAFMNARLHTDLTQEIITNRTRRAHGAA